MRPIRDENRLHSTGHQMAAGLLAGFARAHNHDTTSLEPAEDFFRQINGNRADGNGASGNVGAGPDVFANVKGALK